MTTELNQFGVASADGFEAFKSGKPMEPPEELEGNVREAWIMGYKEAQKAKAKKESRDGLNNLDEALDNFYDEDE